MGYFEINGYGFNPLDILFNCTQSSIGCPAGYYRCNNAVCVLQSKTCDAANDCGDDSDEDDSLCATYMRYNFEGSIGDFTQGISGVEDTTDWHSKAGGEFVCLLVA